MLELTPRQIVSELDKYIVGQDNAKKCVAVALRNRYRRKCLGPAIQDAVSYTHLDVYKRQISGSPSDL